ncbi:MAG: polymerase sigma-B factor [Chloroflexota bacterium]|nr:polymerase sigma-B factor [Chloroflexota bacterium]
MAQATLKLPDAEPSAPLGRSSDSPAFPHKRDEVRRLLAEYACGREPAVRDRLVQLNVDMVRFIARRFANRGEPLEDIEQVGFVGLIQAVERFDPSLENEFSTFATPTITGEIRRHFRDRSWAVRVPRRLQEGYTRVMRAREELSHALGREPSVMEIAEHAGLEPDEVLAAFEVSPARRAVSLDSTLRRGPDDDGVELHERLGQEDGNLERVETRAVVEQSMAHLSPREREIMALRFFDQLPQRAVAQRLGISQMHVSRLQRSALEHMRRDLLQADAAETPAVSRPPARAAQETRPAARPAARAALRWLPVDALDPRADQPRQSSPPGALTELAESIRRWGMLQPIRVREGAGGRYQIVAGERRWTAARQLGLREVPTIVVSADDDMAFIESLTENIQREDLNPVERARALKRLRVTLGSQSWEEVGRAIGITRRHVHNLLNVTRLPAEIQADVRVGDLTEKHARALALLRACPAEQLRLWRRIDSDGLSGEAALQLARSLRDSEPTPQQSLRRVRTAIETVRGFLSGAGDADVATVTAELQDLVQLVDVTLSQPDQLRVVHGGRV